MEKIFRKQKNDTLIENLKKLEVKKLIIYGNTTFSQYVCNDLERRKITIKTIIDGYDVTANNTILVSEFLDNYESYCEVDGILIVLPYDVGEKVKKYLLTVNKIKLPIWNIEELMESNKKGEN